MYSVLIVDDEYKIREGLIKYFPWEELGFTIEDSFDNGLSAYNFITSHNIDLVVTDIKMPVYDGVMLAEKIRNLNKKTHIIFLSAYPDFDFAKKGISYGVDAYILKPFDHNELTVVLKKIKNELDEENGVRQNVGYYDQYMELIKKTIEKNLNTITLEGLGEKCRLSSSYISKLFKEQNGITFSQYLLDKKMEKACQMLRNIDYKIYEISDVLGYGNSKNFTRTFKNYYGISPMEYRIHGNKV